MSSAISLVTAPVNSAAVRWTVSTAFCASAAFGFGQAALCEVEDAFRFLNENGGNTLRISLFEQPAALLRREADRRPR